MCAGVYLDRAFRDLVLRKVYCDRNRRVAPSYGFDLVPVLVHAWRAWRLEVAQHLMVLAVFAVALVRVPLDAVIAAGVLALWYLGLRLLRLGVDFSAYYRGRKSFLAFEQMRSRRNALLYAMLGAGLACAAAAVAAWRIGGRGPGMPVPWPDRSGLAGAGVIVLTVAGVVAAMSAVRQIKVGRLREHDSAGKRAARRRLSTIDSQQRHPFTVYSGFRPFIGSGFDFRTWSFAQRLIHSKVTDDEVDREYDFPPFTAADIVGRLKDMIESLRDDDHPETRLPGLTVTDHVFVEGTHAEPYRRILREARDSEELGNAIAAVVANSSDVARHYLACQVESWGGEIVTSVFMHASLQGRALYLEFSTYALMPTRNEYHVIDEIGGTGPASVVRAAGKSIASVPDALEAPRRLAQAPGQLWAALLARRDGTASARRGLNIGTQVSARDAAAADSKETYFQLRDVLQHSKIIERRMIATVGEFLKELGVDTSEFRERARAILNNGVINTGSGTVNVTGSALGERTSVSTESGTPAE